MRILSLCFLLLTTSLFAQKSESPYELSWAKDGTWLGLGLAGSATGFLIIQNKDGSSEEKIMNLDKDNVPFFDRWSAGYHNEDLSKISDVPFGASFVAPFIFMLTDNEQGHFGQLSVMYLESLSTTAALFTISAGLTNRIRPRAYSEEIPIEIRTKSSNTRSFYSGHVAASATATFFAAKVYSDFYPDSKNKWLIWTGAAVIPAGVGALRLGAGQHFLSDVLLGYVLGASSGILIPELHKKKFEDLSFTPVMSPEFNGVYLSYKF